MVVHLAKTSTYAALNEVQLFVQEVFASPSQSLIQEAGSWILAEDEESDENLLLFDKVLLL